MMWEAAAKRIVENGGTVVLGTEVKSLRWLPVGEWLVETTRGAVKQSYRADFVISSAPLAHMLRIVSPSPFAIIEVPKIEYRDLIVVALMTEVESFFEDQWIYVHDRRVRVGRIQNFKSWSPGMVPSEHANCYGLEYFCFEGDDLWIKSDLELIELAKSEMSALGFGSAGDFDDGCVVRQPKAYPVYSTDHASKMKEIRTRIEATLTQSPGDRKKRTSSLQQSRSRDDDRYCGGREHPRKKKPPMTFGHSIKIPNTWKRFGFSPFVSFESNLRRIW